MKMRWVEIELSDSETNFLAGFITGASISGALALILGVMFA
jgi:tetrahydromethanopterin S-methyltransferase subunit B